MAPNLTLVHAVVVFVACLVPFGPDLYPFPACSCLADSALLDFVASVSLPLRSMKANRTWGPKDQYPAGLNGSWELICTGVFILLFLQKY